ncbi:dynamin family protein [Mesobacterium pallidum]|uniref:dynamin family protein n=1 Tax=Mesobacterium pallidum TaxID=2872037 RepID=UPI001EE1E048|nr:dynamin family protein [Mesobacterium pallidum]
MSQGKIRRMHREGFEELNQYWESLDALEGAVESFAEDALSFVDEPIERVLDRIRSFEPSVSIIGQIKAGKSTLLNALVGETDLLPSDVNPWTSVITGLHLNSRHRPMDTRALFRFFDSHEWDRLVATGGRLGEMASRAGFETEADEVRAQVSEMRETTEARLGDQFDELLGKSHAFPDLDRETINRYICYGDPSELAGGAQEGVYADLTKSADLYLDNDDLPRGLLLRDTPGVNDTFMMREQITLNAISDSRVCVVVLSAHQALSTMDVALLRIICAVEAREVLIFVNRIDELPDPEGEQVRIRSSIQRTLARLGLNQDIEILFGSGYWANFALSGKGTMSRRSQQSLATMFEGEDLSDIDALREAALQASGVPALHRAIARRVVEGVGAAFLSDLEREIETIIEMSETVENATEVLRDGKGVTLTRPDLMLRVGDVLQQVTSQFDQGADELRASLRERLERSQATYVTSAVESLQAHIAMYGETGSWDNDPMSLRMAMKTAFNSACSKLRREGEAGFMTVLDQIQDILQNDLGVFRDGDKIEFPEQPVHQAPTVLARTLSLDLDGGWWQKIWSVAGSRRLMRIGAAKKVEKKYRTMIIDETTPLIDDLITQFYDPAVDATRDIITTFALDQGKFCEAMLERISRSVEEIEAESRFGVDDDDAALIRRISA